MNRDFDRGLSKQVNEVTAVRRPTVDGWEPHHLLADLLELRDLAYLRRMYGPFDLLLAPAWEPHVDQRYWLSAPPMSEQERLAELRRMEEIMARATNTPVQDVTKFPKPVDGRLVRAFSLRERLLQVEGINEVKTDPTLLGYDIALASLVDYDGVKVGDRVLAES